MYVIGTAEDATIGLNGIQQYDIDGKEVMSDLNDESLRVYTTLTKDLKDGDMQIYVKDASILKKNDDQFHEMLFWNYKDSTGHLYPEFIYTRNQFNYKERSYGSTIDVENNIVPLEKAWDHGTFEKGTKISMKPYAGTADSRYILNDNNPGFKPTTEKWELLKTNIGGFHRNKTGTWDHTSFYNATKRIGTWLVYAAESIKYSRVIFGETDKYEQKFTIDMSDHEPLRSKDKVADYIDYNKKQIVRKIGNDGNILDEVQYEDIELPKIPTYDGNTIIETTDEVMPILEVKY